MSATGAAPTGFTGLTASAAPPIRLRGRLLYGDPAPAAALSGGQAEAAPVGCPDDRVAGCQLGGICR